MTKKPSDAVYLVTGVEIQITLLKRGFFEHGSHLSSFLYYFNIYFIDSIFCKQILCPLACLNSGEFKF